ncbi:MAG: hypothetical protein K0S74_746 [Chlamydiales bacterium]|jgi:hypothetical protein|nr:hypothetical protein [Chlamydiales bacterium]
MSIQNNQGFFENSYSKRDNDSDLLLLRGPYGGFYNTTEFRNFLQNNFELIASNIESSDILKQLNQAQIILLGENHNSAFCRQVNGGLINQIWYPEQCKLLTEGKTLTNTGSIQYLHPSISSQLQLESWDVSIPEVSKIRVYLSYLLTLGKNIASLLAYKDQTTPKHIQDVINLFSNILSSYQEFCLKSPQLDAVAACKQDCEDLTQALRVLSSEEDSVDLTNKRNRFVTIDKLSILFQPAFEMITKDLQKVVESTFNLRNENFLNCLLQSATTGTHNASKVIAISGSAHIKPSSSVRVNVSSSSVDMITEGLSQANLKYLILNPHLPSAPAQKQDEQTHKKRILSLIKKASSSFSKSLDKKKTINSSRISRINTASSKELEKMIEQVSKVDRKTILLTEIGTLLAALSSCIQTSRKELEDELADPTSMHIE